MLSVMMSHIKPQRCRSQPTKRICAASIAGKFFGFRLSMRDRRRAELSRRFAPGQLDESKFIRGAKLEEPAFLPESRRRTLRVGEAALPSPSQLSYKPLTAQS